MKLVNLLIFAFIFFVLFTFFSSSWNWKISSMISLHRSYIFSISSSYFNSQASSAGFFTQSQFRISFTFISYFIFSQSFSFIFFTSLRSSFTFLFFFTYFYFFTNDLWVIFLLVTLLESSIFSLLTLWMTFVLF